MCFGFEHLAGAVTFWINMLSECIWRYETFTVFAPKEKVGWQAGGSYDAN